MIAKSVSQQICYERLEKVLDEWKSYGAVSTPKEIIET